MNRNIRNDWRLASAPLRMLPSFVVAGETKCGTTTLYRFMTRHPGILPADVKEPNNFIEYGASPLFCRQHFPLRATAMLRRLREPRVITGEASAEYLSKARVPEAVAAVVPDAKLIVMLRDPVRRALSDYQMMKKAGREPEEFAVCMRSGIRWLSDPSLSRLVDIAARADLPPLRYVTKGCYARSLEPWLKLFPRDRFLFLLSEDFFKDPAAVYRQVFRFLGLRDVDVGPVDALRKGEGGALDPALESELRAFYAPHNRTLAELTGLDVNWS